jgi:hypothetical protein
VKIALNNAAHINLTSHNFYQSFELSTRALSNADAVVASDPKLGSEMKDLKSKAALTAAIASARLGNESAAQQLRSVAIENGSKKAVSLSLPSSLAVVFMRTGFWFILSGCGARARNPGADLCFDESRGDALDWRMTRNIWRRTAFTSINGEVEVAPDDWTLLNPDGEPLARLYKVSGGPQDGRWYWTVLFRPDGSVGGGGNGIAESGRAAREACEARIPKTMRD